MKTPPGTAYGYCRISRDRDESVSIEAQEAAVRRYIALRLPDHRVEIVIDRGVSGGTKLLSRGGGSVFARAGNGDHIVAAKLDRVFRSLTDGAAMIERFTRAGVGLHVMDLHLDTSTPMGRAMAHVVIVFAQLERERIAERLREAAAFRRNRGDCMHTEHNPPYGWAVIGTGKDRRYVRDPHCRRLAMQIYKLHKEGYGYRWIELIAAERGWVTRYGRPWSRTSIRRAIQAAKAGFPPHSPRVGERWKPKSGMKS